MQGDFSVNICRRVASSLLVKERLDVGHHGLWGDTVLVELNHVAVTIDEVLSKVPLDFGVGHGGRQVLVQRTGIVTFDVAFAQNGERDSKLSLNPLEDLLLGPGLLGTKLVAGVAEDLEASATMRLVHFLVLAIVSLGQASLRGNIDHNDGFGSLGDGTEGHGVLFSDLSH